jgi:Protein of unknown function (DUF2752)
MATTTTSPQNTKPFWLLTRKYLWQRIFLVAIVAYMIFSVLLYAATDIDICIPCLWTAVFGVHCPGCGLTTATINIARLDFAGAWEANKFAFIVLPAILIFVYQDIAGFLKKEAHSAT